MIEEAFLVLSQSVVMLIGGRDKAGVDVISPLTRHHRGIHRPGPQIHQHRPFRRADRQVLGVGRNFNGQTLRFQQVRTVFAAECPTCSRRQNQKAVTRRGGGGLFVAAKGQAHDVVRVRFEPDRAPASFYNKLRLRMRRAGNNQQ